MSQQQSTRKLRFPGMLDGQYQQYRQKLIQSDKISEVKKKSDRTLSFKTAADGLLPGWDTLNR